MSDRYRTKDMGPGYTHRFRVVDSRYGEAVENLRGRSRRFYTLEAAARYADALNRGARRVSGVRP